MAEKNIAIFPQMDVNFSEAYLFQLLFRNKENVLGSNRPRLLYGNLNGNSIISSVESTDNPNFTARVLARNKTRTIVKIEINVHIHDSGVKR